MAIECENVLTVVQLNTKTWTFEATKNGAPFNLTGYLIFLTVKKNFSDADVSALIEKTIVCPNDSNSQAGIAVISLSSTDTNISVGNWPIDITLQQNSGSAILFRKTVYQGILRVNAAGSKRTS